MKNKEKWRVRFYESELGGRSDSWERIFDSSEEAFQVFRETNKDFNPDKTPDYYIIAYQPEKIS